MENIMATLEWKEENIDKMRQYRRDWYYRNKKHQIDSQLDVRRKKKEELIEWKKTQFCMDCNVSFNEHPEIAEFHHREPSKKLSSVSGAIHSGKTYFNTEIEKCDLICANCHKIRHVKMRP